MLFKLLAVRFGTLPSWVRERVDGATKAELDEMSVKFVHAQTIGDVVGMKESSAKPKPRRTKSK